ncbi:MAG: peptidase S8 [Chloroflexi bacterium]|nr:peptidase S8 [Chloroflexota bacterium]
MKIPRQALCLAVLLGLLASQFGAAPARAASGFATAGEEILPGQLVVGYRKVADANALLATEGVEGVLWRSELNRLGVAILSVEAGRELDLATQIENAPGIRFVEPNYRVTAALAPNDTLFGGQYGLDHVNAPEAWDITTGSTTTILAVIDSGIELTHPEFSGRIVSGYDYVDRDRTPQDVCGHGTHVAGVAAATGDNLQGVAGVNWQVKIMPLRVLDGYCLGTTADVAAALVYAADHGADVVNLSLGTSAPSTLMENGTYYAYSQGVTVVAAAGNAGSSSVFYPAAYPWVLAVGSTDTAGDRAAFSNGGSALDLMAPGVDILSTTPSGYFYYQQVLGTTSNYGELSGTSLSAPFVSGAAALLAGQPGFDWPDEIVEALTMTALDMDAAGFDNNTGYGLLQIDAALAYTPTVAPPPPHTPSANYDILNSPVCANLVEFNWRTTSTALPIFGSNGYNTFTLPFTFNFGGVDYTEVTVSANGYLTFGGAGNVPDNFLLPGIAQPNELIAPFWDNLNPSAGGQIYGDTLGSALKRVYVVEWRNVPRASESGGLTFQVVLHEGSHEIQFQYKTLQGSGSTGDSATVGLEFDAGLSGVQVGYNQRNTVAEGQAIRLRPYTTGEPLLSDNCVEPADEGEAGNTELASLSRKAGPEGGTFDLMPFCVNLPAGLLESEARLTLQLSDKEPPAPPDWVELGAYVDIELTPSPDYASQGYPIVCYRYTAQDLLAGGGYAFNLFLAYFDPATRTWRALSTAADEGQGILYAYAPHFSTFGVFAARPDTLPQTGAAFAWDTATCLPLLLMALMLGLAGWARRRNTRRAT